MSSHDYSTWLTYSMLEFIGSRHLLQCFGIFNEIKSRICQSGATIVVQILSSASKAPTAHFPLITTLNNNYNLCCWKGSIEVWIISCFFKWPDGENFFSKIEQLNGFSLVWILSRLFKSWKTDFLITVLAAKWSFIGVASFNKFSNDLTFGMLCHSFSSLMVYH